MVNDIVMISAEDLHVCTHAALIVVGHDLCGGTCTSCIMT